MERQGLARQGGMGMFGLILIIGLLAFFLTLLFKLGPAYMTFMTVKSIMDGLPAQSSEVEGAVSAREILSRIGRQLDINGVSQVSPKDFKVQRTDDGIYQARVDYEQRAHLFFNVDAVMTFAYQVDVVPRGPGTQ